MSPHHPPAPAPARVILPAALALLLTLALTLPLGPSPARAGQDAAQPAVQDTAPSPAPAPTELVVAWSEFTPWRTLENNKPGGRDLALVRALADRLDLNLRITPCASLAQALELLRTGRADITTSLLDTPERRAFLRFAEPQLRTDAGAGFYARAGVRPVRRYDDLLGLRIALKRGSSLFPEFDQDRRMVRLPLPTARNVLALVAAGQADVAALDPDEAVYWINRLHLSAAVRPCAFAFPGTAPVYLAIGQASPLADRLPEIQDALRQWRDSGRLAELLAPLPPADAP